MPLRQSKARLWFKTKQELDEYDDKMISQLEIKSEDESSPNFTLVFQRSKKQYVLQLSDKAGQEADRLLNIYNGKNYIDKYLAGKNDNTAYRQWTFDKIGFTWAGGYLLLRELPIRNFYARCGIMILFISQMSKDYINPINMGNGTMYATEDQWTGKDVRNYGIFEDVQKQVIPHNNNRLPEYRLWKLAQPAYLRRAPERSMLTQYQIFFPPAKRELVWDGTFNMPLEGLAHPLHKDARFLNFINK